MAISLTTGQQAAINNGLMDLHNLFARPLYYRKESEQVVLTEDPNHSSTWGSAPQNTTTTTNLVTGSFNARIYWGKNVNESLNANGTNTDASLPAGYARIITNAEGKEIVESSTRIVFEDEIFEIDSSRDRHGLLQKNMFNYYLKPSQ